MDGTVATPDERQTLSLPEAGKILGIGRSSIFKAAARGYVPTIRIGRRVLVSKLAFQRLLAGERT
jgi:excisionase family DNA binding protein